MKKLTFFALTLAMILTNGAQAFSLYSIFDAMKQHPFVTTIFFGTAAFFGYRKASAKIAEIRMKKATTQLPQLNVFIPYHLQPNGGFAVYSKWPKTVQQDYHKTASAIGLRNMDSDAFQTYATTNQEKIDVEKALELSLKDRQKPNTQPKSTIKNLNSMEQ